MAPQAEVYLTIGSNLEPERNIPEALTLLSAQVRLDGVSTFYRSAPLGRPDQPPFLNGACRLFTDLPPRDLKFHCLRPLEGQLGRMRSRDKFAARTIDLDIALYGSVAIREPDLEIPDPDIRNRPFLAVPLLELAPEAVLPDTGEALASIVQSLDGSELAPDEAFTAALRARLPL
jgi:2-amino-4-hydroxy-6-hydroxymethyldihydropteridine diphosphokinase